ncbi:hypothetical protein [Desulforamulus aquiferis]|uniref:DUF2007 domain-containing protein n=1 Tax=Desulforamulus aquiferis TaxID=1397668 RepID=A0AAW7ZCQ1_9FIRM|nr:hypothetical protein [Desulforamulus aquiferis]MDO7787102.1 hypothetical protein [Desulforamulus aquiferis]
MFCPKCKCEYREGFTVCADCKIQLVDELQEEIPQNKEYIQYVYIMSSLNPGEITFIKSILESENITYYIKGENNLYTPLTEPARVMVSKEQAELVKVLLREL